MSWPLVLRLPEYALRRGRVGDIAVQRPLFVLDAGQTTTQEGWSLVLLPDLG